MAIGGWYSRKMFPGLLDWTMNQATLKPIREGVLAQASGNILEIGFGTGVNLPCYPSAVSLVTAIDPNPGMVPFDSVLCFKWECCGQMEHRVGRKNFLLLT